MDWNIENIVLIAVSHLSTQSGESEEYTDCISAER